jgi:thiol-disulfide isomerase/thioredoxin
MRLSYSYTILAALAFYCLLPLAAQTLPAYFSNPKFIDAITEAKKMTHDRQYADAIDAYKKASKIAAGQDAECLKQLFALQMKTSSFKDAAATSTALEAIAVTPLEKSFAESSRGHALYYQAGDKNKPDLLNTADTSFKAAIANYPKNAAALYLDGLVLARLGQIDAARVQFKACLSCTSPQDPSYVRAQHFAENPALSLEKMAPAFTVTALDGTRFNLDEMNGRVVLIDFWATWCVPCRKELPHIQQIAKDFAGEPLVILSISWDEEQQVWKDFIAKNGMTWPQYRDTNHQLGQLFEIEGLPSYFTIDSNGVLTSESLGGDSDIDGRLKKLVAQAKKF